MADLDLTTVLAERLQRQRLSDPLQSAREYVDLFRLLQPVSPIADSRPGDPPRLVHRTRFDDGQVAARLRARRTIVKGRFLGGSLGYVLAEDLALYANAFQRPASGLTEIQEIVLDAVQSAGPLTPRQIKEETGLLNKEIMPALHRLQQAFLVYEDQVDEDWERGWYDFAGEWPEVEVDEGLRPAAARQVLLRFLQGHVLAMWEQMRDWSRWPVRFLEQLVQEMERAGQIVPRTVEGLDGGYVRSVSEGHVRGGSEGWMRAEDVDLPARALRPSALMLHRADILVQSHASELKRRFGGLEVLQYLLVDGQFQEAVLGHWRIGPHDVDDIVLTLPAAERADRRAAILAAVGQVYHPPHSRILRYAGQLAQNPTAAHGRRWMACT